jgi:imidazolonepropionase-like amidohydrolase
VPDRKRRRGLWNLAGLIAAAALAGCGDGREQADLLVTAPRLFDGERMIRNGGVAVRGDEIVAVGARGDLDVDAKRTLALRDATLLPGLIDMHTHGLGLGQLGSVVTTVRDLGTDDRNLPLQAAPHEPRVVAAGPLITAPGGYPIPIHGRSVAHVVRNPEGARAYVRSLADRGAGVIKVSLQFGFPVIEFATLRALVEEAHTLELRVTAHVGESRGARMALAAGVDELAHMPCGEDPELMRALVDAGLEIVATLHVIELVVGCPGPAENAAAFARAGGTLLYGSDYGVVGIPRGIVVEELELLADAGLEPIEALRAATGRAGELLPLEGVGRLAEGGPADLVAVRGDPTRRLAALQDPLLIVLRGRIQLGG